MKKVQVVIFYFYKQTWRSYVKVVTWNNKPRATWRVYLQSYLMLMF